MLNYYLRKDIALRILEFSKNREIAVKYKNGKFGKRPLTLSSITEIFSYVKRGVTSFHCSEERWVNPLLLTSTSKEEDLKKNRIGWDLVIDIDGLDLELSKIVAELIFKLFKRLNVKNATIKFSGNKGFHIGIPFESFSKEILGYGLTKDLFPDVARRIAAYITYEIKEELDEKIKNLIETEHYSKKLNIKKKEIYTNNGEIITSKLVDIDTILISSRHLFRMPYSLNEKSGLVSIPILPERIKYFTKKEAQPNQVSPRKYSSYEFLFYNKQYGTDGDILIIKAYEKDYEPFLITYEKEEQKTIEIKETIEQNRFPESIKYILNTKLEDGRKRSLFILLTFFTSVNWSFENIEKIIYEWGKKQDLKETYIKSQINWFKKINKKINPPNFTKEMYWEAVPQHIINKDINYRGKKNKNPLQCIRKKTKNNSTKTF